MDGRDERARYYNFPSLPELVDAYLASGPWEIVGTDHHIGDPAGPSERGAWLAVTVRKPIPGGAA
jgi:hypothetical protein